MNSSYLSHSCNIAIKLLSQPLDPADMLKTFLLIEVLHLNHYNQELQFTIPTLIETLLNMNPLDKETRIHRVLAILALGHNY